SRARSRARRRRQLPVRGSRIAGAGSDVRLIGEFPAAQRRRLVGSALQEPSGHLVAVGYVGDRPDQGLALSAYSEADVAAWTRFRRDLRGAVRVENLTDEHYLIRAGQYSLGRTIILSIDGLWE